MDYGDTLSPKDRVWLRTFSEEFYGGRFEARGKQIHAGEMQKECRRRTRSHAKDRRPDLVSFAKENMRADMEEAASLPAPGGGEDEMIDRLDAKRFAEWRYRRRVDIATAMSLNRQLRRSRWLLRKIRQLMRDARSATSQAGPTLDL